jgi:hypothetical protein
MCASFTCPRKQKYAAVSEEFVQLIYNSLKLSDLQLQLNCTFFPQKDLREQLVSAG